MQIIIVIIIGITGLGVIVFIHELGHFLAAKYCKVEVVEFALGMGPKLLSYSWGKTLYSIRLLPLGGFCKMKEEAQHQKSFFHYFKKEYANIVIPQTEGTFFMLPVFKKVIVLLAGPGANMLWYVLMSLVLFITGYQIAVNEPRIDPIENKSPYAGLRTGDRITRLNGIEIRSFSQLAQRMRQNAGKKVRLEYTRRGSSYTKDVQLNTKFSIYAFVAPVVEYARKTQGSFIQIFQPNDVIHSVDGVEIENAIRIQDELKKHIGGSVSVVIQRGDEKVSQSVFVSDANPEKAWGIRFATARIRPWNSFSEFLKSRIEYVKIITVGTWELLVKLFTFQKTVKDEIAGPIRIVSIIGDNTVSDTLIHGVVYALWQFINISAIVSFALALANMLPIPVFDGGQVMFYTFHALCRRQPRYRTLAIFQGIGIVMALLLLVFVMFKDISALV